jgi:hypothetical protein
VVDHHLQLAQSIASRWPGRQGDDAGDEPALLVLLPHPRGWPRRDVRRRRRTTIDTGRVFRSNPDSTKPERAPFLSGALSPEGFGQTLPAEAKEPCLVLP